MQNWSCYKGNGYKKIQGHKICKYSSYVCIPYKNQINHCSQWYNELSHECSRLALKREQRQVTDPTLSSFYLKEKENYNNC